MMTNGSSNGEQYSGHSGGTKQVFVIGGPTAVGKTQIAIALAQALGTQIVSADSRQCYHEMKIGTARPSQDEMARVKHYFVDAFPVTENISAARYEQLALAYLDEIFEKNNTAVVCGGTGLYIRALTEGLDEMPPVDVAIESAVNEQYQREGMTWLQQVVAQEDPLFFDSGEKQNPARMLRALIFFRSTGKSITAFRTGVKKQRDFRIIKCALELPRDILYRRINTRVDAMMNEGLLKEATALYPLRHLKNLQTVGYTELFDFLEGKYSLEEAVAQIKQHTRNYAKRQLTWFRKDEEFLWFDAASPGVIDEIISLQ